VRAGKNFSRYTLRLPYSLTALQPHSLTADCALPSKNRKTDPDVMCHPPHTRDRGARRLQSMASTPVCACAAIRRQERTHGRRVGGDSVERATAHLQLQRAGKNHHRSASQPCTTSATRPTSPHQPWILLITRALVGALRTRKRVSKCASGGAKGSAGGRRALAQAFPEVDQL